MSIITNLTKSGIRLTPKLTPTCSECGSDKIKFDAFADYDPETESYGLAETFDAAVCESDGCEGKECTVKWIYPPPTITQHFAAIAKEAGLEVMAEVLEIIHSRDGLEESVLRKLTADDVTRLYDDYIAPAIDEAEEDIERIEAAAEFLEKTSGQ